MPKQTKGYFYLFIALFLWGIHGPAGKFLATRGIDMAWVAAVRVWIGTFVFCFYLLLRKELPHAFAGFKEKWKLVVSLSFVGLFLNTLTYHFALYTISGTLLMILENLAPVFVFFFSYLLLKEPPTFRQIMALILSLAGMLLIIHGKDAFEVNGISALPGIIWGILAGATFGWYTFFSRQLMQHIGSQPDKVIIFLFRIFLISSVLLAPFVFYPCARPQKWDEWFWLFEMGIFQSAAAYIFWNQALRWIPANTASVLFLFTILFTAINEFLFLSLPLNISLFAGSLLIIYAGRIITKKIL